MPLDPDLALIFRGAAPPQSHDLDKMRQAAIDSSALLPRRPVTIAGTRDLLIPGPACKLPARLYTPQGLAPARGWPLTVFYHGSGFVAYNIETHDQLCRELCAGANTAVLSVEYRLAPEHKFPAPVDDAYAAYVWAAQHAAELGGAASRLAVAGDSAGASLGIAVTLRARDEHGPALAAQLLMYPITDFVNPGRYPSREENDGYLLTGEGMDFSLQMYLSGAAHAAHPHVSPLHAANLANLPTALILTAEFDPLRDEGAAYAQALGRAGVRAQHQSGPGMVHGFASMTGLSPAAAALMDTAAA